MKVSNAIKKLSKYGNVTQDGQFFRIIQDTREIQFARNGSSEDIICIRVRSIHDKDDFMTDYHAGTFCDNITQAIRLARFVEILPKSKSSIVMKKYPKVKSLKTLSVSAKDFIGIPKGVEVK